MQPARAALRTRSPDAAGRHLSAAFSQLTVGLTLGWSRELFLNRTALEDAPIAASKLQASKSIEIGRAVVQRNVLRGIFECRRGPP